MSNHFLKSGSHVFSDLVYQAKWPKFQITFTIIYYYLLLFTNLLTLFVLPKQIAVNTIYFFPTLRSFECLISWTFHFFISHLSIFFAMCGSISNLLVKPGSCYHSVWSWFYLKSQFLVLVVVIGMLGVQLQINHESLPKERKILSECEARGQNLVLLVMTSD